MRIVQDYPPNHKEIEERFGPLPEGVIFTYGDIIYSPRQSQLANHLIAHEEVHSRQQMGDPVGWWERYLVDDDFRLEQEVEAYREQYKYIRKFIRDGNMRIRLLVRISSDLSGTMYGSIVTFSEAKALILDR